MAPIIRVFVLTDQAWLRTNLRTLLATASDLQLVGEADTVQALPALCRKTRPQVVLTAGRLKPFVFDIPRLLAPIRPAVKVIALLNPADELRAQALLATDLAGCLFEHEINAALLDGIRGVARGGEWISRALAQHLLTQPLHHPPTLIDPIHLSKREQKILALLAQGCDNAQIAATLYLADHTVRNYVSTICKKLGVERQAIPAHFK